jgi:hypothetical protein
MSQNNLENQLTKTNGEGLLIKLFSIIIGHKRLQAPAKSHPTGMTRLQKKDYWIQKRLHRGCKMFGESCKLFFLSREREHSPHHWFSPFMWGSQKEKDIKFFLSSTRLHSCCLRIGDHNQISQILAAYGERASSEVAKRLRA